MTFAVIVGLLYCTVGILWFGAYPEIALVAAVVTVVTGMLPEIDSDSPPPAREVGGFIAAVTPIMFMEIFPGIKAGGVIRITLTVIACYLITRVFIVRLLQKHTVQMGMIHSVPAAIITFEVVYLMFWDLTQIERLFVAGAAFTGYFSHLLLDASSNLDLFGSATGNAKKNRSPLKFISDSTGVNIFTYGLALYLGWFVITDFYPNLGFSAGIQY